jgi:hypothetical protein
MCEPMSCSVLANTIVADALLGGTLEHVLVDRDVLVEDHLGWGRPDAGVVADVERDVDACEHRRRCDVVAQVGTLERVRDRARVDHVGREEAEALVVEQPCDGAPESSGGSGDEHVRSVCQSSLSHRSTSMIEDARGLLYPSDGPEWSWEPGRIVDGEARDVAAALVGGEEQLAGRVDREVARAVAAARHVTDRRQRLAGTADRERRNAVVTSVRDVHPVAVGVNSDRGGERLADEVVGQRRDRPARHELAGRARRRASMRRATSVVGELADRERDRLVGMEREVAWSGSRWERELCGVVGTRWSSGRRRSGRRNRCRDRRRGPTPVCGSVDRAVDVRAS